MTIFYVNLKKNITLINQINFYHSKKLIFKRIYFVILAIINRRAIYIHGRLIQTQRRELTNHTRFWKHSYDSSDKFNVRVHLSCILYFQRGCKEKIKCIRTKIFAWERDDLDAWRQMNLLKYNELTGISKLN